MKNNILKIIDELSKKEYFNNHEFSLTVNFKKIIPDYNTVPFNENSIKVAIKKLNKIKNVKNFNITIKIKRDTEKLKIEDYTYPVGWKTVQFIFYSGSEEEKNNKFNTSKYGMFDFDTLGDRESFRLTSKSCKVYHDDNGNHKSVYGNHFEYDKLNTFLDDLIELDILLDKQNDEKIIIFNRLMKYI